MKPSLWSVSALPALAAAASFLGSDHPPASSTRATSLGCTGPLAISVTSMPSVGNANFALTLILKR